MGVAAGGPWRRRALFSAPLIIIDKPIKYICHAVPSAVSPLLPFRDWLSLRDSLKTAFQGQPLTSLTR